MFEDRPEKDTPQWLIDDLHEYGGESPSGQPIWRMVLAQNCRIHCFGLRNHMPDGFKHSQLSDKGQRTDEGYAVAETRMIQPARIEEGEFWVPRYRRKGWILQHWLPPSVWGTKAKWESEKARDGRTRLLAAFPNRGDYMMMAGYWNTIDQAGDLHAAIRVYHLQQRKNPANWDNYLRSLTSFEELERQNQADQYAEELAAQHRLGIEGILRTVSSSAQEFRNIVSKHSAGGVQLGGSEKWG